MTFKCPCNVIMTMYLLQVGTDDGITIISNMYFGCILVFDVMIVQKFFLTKILERASKSFLSKVGVWIQHIILEIKYLTLTQFYLKPCKN